ncbi:hypothetical protein GDO86_003801 [Hymenochirus boettgeri]|uniref:BEN domain-containing protein n=1 Tax=Hymenochirus boettgeri TaxID=247094 RepID=A0A8T2KAY0_9PIPI|nr:hypothetical protein GDO86_003801 [Hymenochirus boettgeri]
MKTAVVLLKDNQASDASPLASSESYQSSDDMDYFGARSRNIMLPAMVMFKGKQKVRPELSARYFIKHLFTDDVLIQSNVFGNPDRGVLPLDPNKIGALREFLQENYDTFDLNETGQDWRLCVAGINSTIRSIRYERKVEVKKITNKSRKRIATVTSS